MSKKIKDEVREEVISIVITLLFVLGFLLINSGSITGLVTFGTDVLAQSSSYYLRMYTLGLQGDTPEGATYEGRMLLTAFQPGYRSGEGSTYEANIGFFSGPTVPGIPPAVEEEEEGKGSSSGVGSSGEREASTVTESVVTMTGNLYGINYAVPGETVLIIDNPLLAIYEVVLDINREAENIFIRIDETRNMRGEKPGERAYRFATIAASNLEDSALNKVIIRYRVQKGWSKESILQQYFNLWRGLDTKKTGEDKYFDYYESETTGFGIFAITTSESVLESIISSVKPSEIVEDVKEGRIGKLIWVIVIILSLLFMIMHLMKIKPINIKALTKRARKDVNKDIKEVKSELLDLKNMFEEGLLSEEYYRRQKEKLHESLDSLWENIKR